MCLLLVAMPGAASSVLAPSIAMQGAPVACLLLVAMPEPLVACLLLVAMPGAPSSVLAPSSDARSH